MESAARAPVRIVGSYLSPYVREALVALAWKSVPYEIDPIVPFGDDRVSLADSSVICQYLEDRYPEPALYPVDIADRAHARSLEEYADSRMGEVFKSAKTPIPSSATRCVRSARRSPRRVGAPRHPAAG